jgi:flagellar biogenesis protein FliO
MATGLGLLGLVGFMVAVIALAASITWIVVKVTPQRRKSEQSAP